MTDPAEVTRLLEACRDGDGDALERLFPLVYDELRGLADRQLQRERAGHTLQATALVHEAWMRLVDQRNRDWSSRSHFMAIAATAMRRILVNHANKRLAQKRGGDRERVPLLEGVATFDERAQELVFLDEALEKLAGVDASKARLVELRFFAGLSNEETADVLDVSTRTVERNWRLARAWLRREMGAPARDE